MLKEQFKINKRSFPEYGNDSERELKEATSDQATLRPNRIAGPSDKTRETHLYNELVSFFLSDYPTTVDDDFIEEVKSVAEVFFGEIVPLRRELDDMFNEMESDDFAREARDAGKDPREELGKL